MIVLRETHNFDDNTGGTAGGSAPTYFTTTQAYLRNIISHFLERELGWWLVNDQKCSRGLIRLGSTPGRRTRREEVSSSSAVVVEMEKWQLFASD